MNLLLFCFPSLPSLSSSYLFVSKCPSCFFFLSDPLCFSVSSTSVFTAETYTDYHPWPRPLQEFEVNKWVVFPWTFRSFVKYGLFSAKRGHTFLLPSAARASLHSKAKLYPAGLSLRSSWSPEESEINRLPVEPENWVLNTSAEKEMV